jgi:RNA recognition motif-containing protein
LGVVFLQGYAFVVFASPAVVSRAIEELDCKAVEGKILAVQRATDGKAACSSTGGGGSSSFPRDGGHSLLGNSVNNNDMGSNAGRDVPAGGAELPLQQGTQRKYRSSNSSSGSSSGSNGGQVPAAHTAAGGAAAAPAAAGTAGVSALADVEPLQQQQQGGVMPHHRRTGSAPQATFASQHSSAAAAAARQMALPPNEGSSLGQRLLAAVTGGVSNSSSNRGAGAAANGLKQYDVNELYIGDLPLSWDEDAVRRLLGRYGKVSGEHSCC